MRRFSTLLFIILSFTSLTYAQNEWQIPIDNSHANEVIDSLNSSLGKELPDAKYLSGAVPVNDKGEIVFTKEVDNHATASENYEICLNRLAKMTKSDTSLPESRILVVNDKRHIIVAQIEEWMVFRSSLFELDRARFTYMVIAECYDNKIIYSISRLNYKYEGNSKREQTKYKAEEIIRDDIALNKKNHLRRGNAKFRRKTIDRVNEILKELN